MDAGTAPARGGPTPLATLDRIPALDVVRGFALLGIFLMNVEFFTRPLQDIGAEGVDPSLRGIHYAADWLVYFFVQGKFWTLFSLLFGMGFAVMIDRAERAGRSFAPVYLRRSVALLGIGLAHSLLVWSGDILVSYAIGALILLLARQLRRSASARLQRIPRAAVAAIPARRLAGWGLLLYCLIPAAVLLAGLVGTMMPDATPSATEVQAKAAERAGKAERRAAAMLAYRDGTYSRALAQRVADTGEQLGDLPPFLPFVLGSFLIGAALVRSGVAARPQDFQPQLRSARNLGLPLGFGLMAISVGLGTTAEPERFDLRHALQISTFLIAGLVLALAYAATLALALHGAAGAWLERWLAPAGRMALTNYLLQSVIGTMYFYGYGLGQWGLARAWQLVFVLVVFAVQVVVSRWWLARWRLGPVEWLWRAFTYWRWPSLRIAAAGAP